MNVVKKHSTAIGVTVWFLLGAFWIEFLVWTGTHHWHIQSFADYQWLWICIGVPLFLWMWAWGWFEH